MKNKSAGAGLSNTAPASSTNQEEGKDEDIDFGNDSLILPGSKFEDHVDANSILEEMEEIDRKTREDLQEMMIKQEDHEK